MKNIQVIDGAVNSIYEIYSVTDKVFSRLFPNDSNIAFAEDFPEGDPLWTDFYKQRVSKESVNGIHGTLHLRNKAAIASFFPTRRETDV